MQQHNVFELFSASADTPQGVTAENLSKVWRISHDEAKRMLEVMTQLNQQSADTSLARRFGTNDLMLL